MKSLLVALVTALVVSAPAFAQEPPAAPLAPGRRIYVVHAAKRDDLADALTRELKAWGRWPVADHEAEADLVATIAGKGSNKAGTVAVTIKRGADGPTLWQSEDTGHRWFGPESAFLRALDVIIERLKEASNSWPQS